MLAAKARHASSGLLQCSFQPSGIWPWSHVWKPVIPLQEVWLGETSHKPPSACWVLEKNGITGLQSSMQLQSALWEGLSTVKGVIFSTRWWSSGPTEHVASQLASVTEDILHFLQAVPTDCTPKGGHVPGAGACTPQPRQGATTSSWKVATMAKSVCVGMGMCHTCSRIQWVFAMESYPHLSLTPQVSTVYCIIVVLAVSSASCDLADGLRPLSTVLFLQYTKL